MTSGKIADRLEKRGRRLKAIRKTLMANRLSVFVFDMVLPALNVDEVREVKSQALILFYL